MFDFIMPLPDKFLVGAHVRDSLIICHTPVTQKIELEHSCDDQPRQVYRDRE